MTEQDFGRLEKIDLRKGWPTEAGDFTPWLAEANNIKLLGETIGLELEPLHTEHPVGPYRADIVCEDTESEELVLIETQLDKTDHRHLGQLLTYAAGLKAVTVVWIARKFTEEHQSALEWLNNHTDDSIRMFGLEIELWRIGSSAPAPKFNIVAKPNEWIKAGSSMRSAGLNERKAGQLEYWTEFDEWLSSEDNDRQIKLAPPRGKHWMSETSYATTGLTNTLTIMTSKKEIGVEIYLGRTHGKARFALLEEHKESINREFGEDLDWQLLPESIASRIKATLPDSDWQDKQDRLRQFEWLKSALIRLKSVVQPHLMDMRALAEDHEGSTDDDDS